MKISSTPEAERKADRLEELLANVSLLARQLVRECGDGFAGDLAAVNLEQVKALEALLEHADMEVELGDVIGGEA